MNEQLIVLCFDDGEVGVTLGATYRFTKTPIDLTIVGVVANVRHVAQELDAQKQHEHEAEQFHRRLDVALGEKGRKAGEGDETIRDLHASRPQPDQRRPLEAAARAFVEDGKVDRPNRNRQQQPAQKPGYRRRQDRCQDVHQTQSLRQQAPPVSSRTATDNVSGKSYPLPEPA